MSATEVRLRAWSAVILVITGLAMVALSGPHARHLVAVLVTAAVTWFLIGGRHHAR